jgi:hypothetical protein
VFENASSWLNVDMFMGWLSVSFQSAKKPANPISLQSNQLLSMQCESHSMLQPRKNQTVTSPSCPKPHLSIPIEISDSSDAERQPMQKRKRPRSSSIKAESADQHILDLVGLTSEDFSDSDYKIVSTGLHHSADGRRKAKSRKLPSGHASDSEGRIRITHQLTCRKLVTLTSIPSCWTVPQPGEEVVYLLDLSDDVREWKDASGDLLSMAGIIKSQVHILVVQMTLIYNQSHHRIKTHGVGELVDPLI